MAVQLEDRTSNPQYLVEDFQNVYRILYGCQPNVRYVGNQWYMVNSEFVHRTALLHETDRLRTLARKQRAQRNDRSTISRVIARLRGL
jgi:hypothetical protein